MNDLERFEHRYFCDSSSSDSVEKTLNSFEILTRISYPLPVTETIYFTYGAKAGYEAPTGLTIRLRRYASELSDIMEITGDTFLLEIKTDNRASGISVKERISISGVDAIKLFAGIDDRFSLRQRLGIGSNRQLLPTGAMQSYRCHWIHQSGLRLTFDKDIRFFLFKENLYVARMVATLGEAKLEFKFPKASECGSILEESIVAACGCTKRPPNYLGRKARGCVQMHMGKRAEC